MALNIKNTIRIDGGEPLLFNDLFLSQQVHAHNHFEVSINWEQFTDDGTAIILKAQEFIGKKIEISFLNENDDVAMNEGFFVGIITETETMKSRFSNASDQVVLKGYSPTILMDQGPHCQCFEEKSLADIVTLATQPFSSLLDCNINPLNTDTLPYTVEYNVSTFAFLQHLAIRKGEWMYYNGTTFNFGSNPGETIELKYGVDLTDFNLKMKTQPQKFAFTSHDYINAKDVNGSLPDGTNLPGYNGFMSEKSEELYSTENLVSYHQIAAEGNNQVDLDAAMEVQKEAQVARTTILSGASRNTALVPGSMIKILHKTITGETDYGTYMVTHVNHHCSAAGQDYSNTFEAIPEKVIYPPYTNFNAYIPCEPQRAKVMDNNDPLKMGRIKVQFAWQKDVTTPWIRIAQPHSGADKGFHFLPETGEEVMVGFEGGNAELPFVMGTLFNGNAKAEEFTTDKNDIKAIRTRSGHTIELNDTEGEETITIYDREQNVIQFNTVEKSIKIQAVESVEMIAKNIVLKAEENLELGATKDVNIIADGMLGLQSAKDTTIKSNGAAIIDATKDASIKGMNVTVEGKKNADFKGGVQTNIQGKMTALKGAGFAVEVK